MSGRRRSGSRVASIFVGLLSLAVGPGQGLKLPSLLPQFGFAPAILSFDYAYCLLLTLFFL